MQTPPPPSKEKNGKTKPWLTPGERLRIENLLDDGCVHRCDCPKRNSVCRTCLHTRRNPSSLRAVGTARCA